MLKLDSLIDYCELFDCVILADREDIDNVYPSYRTVYALGIAPELNAGIYGSSLTPYFPSQDELLSYCQSEEGWQQLDSEGLAMFGNDWEEMKSDFVRV